MVDGVTSDHDVGTSPRMEVGAAAGAVRHRTRARHAEIPQHAFAAMRQLHTMGESEGMQFQKIVELPLGVLEISTSQARVRDVDRDLDELVENIRKHGQLEPIVVAPLDGRDRYEIITGQRRYLAHKKLGRPTILAAILRDVVDDSTARAMSLSENIVRRDLNPKDVIDACTSLYRKYGDARAVAEELGLPHHKVKANIKYERLSPELQRLVDSGAVEMTTALRVQDAVDGAEDRLDAARLAKALSVMTRAQQGRLLRTASVRELRQLAETGLTDDRQRVVQIVVTLSASAHALLQEWAKARGTSQDEAARDLIESGLSSETSDERPDVQRPRRLEVAR